MLRGCEGQQAGRPLHELPGRLTLAVATNLPWKSRVPEATVEAGSKPRIAVSSPVLDRGIA